MTEDKDRHEWIAGQPNMREMRKHEIDRNLMGTFPREIRHRGHFVLSATNNRVAQARQNNPRFTAP